MRKPFEVREFDSIICNEQDTENVKYRYLERKEFEELLAFLQEFSGKEDRADALDFMKLSYQRNVGEVITLKNYVGLIQMKNGFQLQVLPKLSFGEEEQGTARTKQVFLKMLCSMRDFPGKAFQEASLQADRMNLYEWFIHLYLQEVRQLAKRGIKSDYIEVESNSRYYKGKLLINQQIKRNLAHQERFFVSYEEFHQNRAENRIVKATLMKLQKLTASAEHSRQIRQLLLAFEQVSPSTNYEKDFSEVVMNRSNREYERLMQWSKVFLNNQSFSTFSGSIMSRALLFPMESVFESYVAQKMKKVMNKDGWEVSCQDRGHYLFLEPRPQFALRPDLVLKKGERTVIMDTKWKRLVDNKKANYGMTQADMYQMYAYSKKYKTSEVWLLYPIHDEMRGHAPIRFDSGDGTTVTVHFVDVERIEENLEELREKLETCER